MWTITELKQNSKQFLKTYLVQAIVVCLIFTIVNNIFEGNNSSGHSSNYNEIEEHGDYEKPTEDLGLDFDNIGSTYASTLEKFSNFGDNFLSSFSSITSILTSVVGGAIISILFIIGILGSIFIVKPLEVGVKRFFIKGMRNDDVKIENMFTTFTDGHWVGYAFKMFYLNVVIFLWTLLLIIPGIIKTYQYYYVPYILSDHPEYSINEAMEISKTMTDGKKMDIFMLNLSFIGWVIVSFFTLGLGFLLLNPYVEGASASLYLYENNEIIIDNEY